jgi:hypothetical protein
MKTSPHNYLNKTTLYIYFYFNKRQNVLWYIIFIAQTFYLAMHAK